MQEKIRLALIHGSTREGRFGDVVVQWAARRIETRNDFALDILDPLAFDLPGRHLAAETAGLAALRRRLGMADAFLIVTPEYNHSYPAALKFVIDSVSAEWQAKPVAFISYGGISGGLRAVEHLRPVFAEVHAVTIRDTVSFANAWRHFDADGRIIDPEPASGAIAIQLDRLHWWADALRRARAERPWQARAA